jgi:hypothetical protein
MFDDRNDDFESFVELNCFANPVGDCWGNEDDGEEGNCDD